ncbi:hypothetical protein SKAU_G00205250 [Synaphobranchus kaupii]|uniref:Uncharacterized protein n=1 Tax=Synaphobranchus kaupii TaxID=118154 RepID=A0A9Q1IY81_SYNKA|nr:hypothetical protein SKAU_G00205250 [Synaphobranchus kaupii]
MLTTFRLFEESKLASVQGGGVSLKRRVVGDLYSYKASWISRDEIPRSTESHRWCRGNIGPEKDPVLWTRASGENA